jgi:hypothetical protein
MSTMNLITAFEAAELRDRDNYPSEDINDLDLDQISQMIEEAAPYTNFLYLKGKPTDNIYQQLIDAKYRVDKIGTVEGRYTRIVWPEI